MIIEHPEAFKAWMTAILEPMCDADPEALAKYVYALVKKDKPTEELRKTMPSQLEVFLQKDTTEFVDLLFSKLESGFKDDHLYAIKIKEEPIDPKIEIEDTILFQPSEMTEEELLASTTDENPSSPLETDQPMEPMPEVANPVVVSPDLKPVVEVSPVKDQVQATVESPRLRNGSFGSSSTLPKEGELRLSSSRSFDRKSDSEREDRGYHVKRRGSTVSPPLRRLDRSRSRSWERRVTTRRSRSKSRRSRSRGRERDRSRAWRNKSPPSRNRCYERDRRMRSWSKSPPARSRSRSPPSKLRSRYRNRSPMGRSCSHSHSPYDSPHKSNPRSGAGTPTREESNHGEDSHMSANSHSLRVSRDISKKRRCRDFDEKGFCMRGEMCPYDHGNDPVVLEDVGQVLSFSSPPGQGLPPPSALEAPAPALGVPMLRPSLTPGLALHHRPQLLNRPPPNLTEYNPAAPSMGPRLWSKLPFRSAGRGMVRGATMVRAPQMFSSHPQRELINVPVMEGEERSYYGHIPNSLKRHCPPEFSNGMESMSPLKQRFDYSRLGSRRGNCSLQLKKIPHGLNNIAHLHNHFVKFGKIVNIQVNFENDPEAALITFTSNAEASAAYKSTEAVLNNRFIKVFWYNPDKDNKQENVSPLNRTSAKDRLGIPIQNSIMSLATASSNPVTDSEVEKVFLSGTNITKTVYIPSALESQMVKQNNNMIITANFQNAQDLAAVRESLIKKQEEKRKEAIKMTQHLSKRKHELIDKLLNHQKVLIEKLERGNITADQRVDILAAIKGFQENIDMIRKDIKTVVTKPPTNAVKVTPQLMKRTREETQKQILDAELDLFNQQQEGKDTIELQKRVYELKTKAHNLGLLTNNGVLRLSRGAARFRATRGRGGFNPHATVDHRPTKLLVSGFESDDKADVLEHFSKFGEVVEHVWDEATPALVIQFKTRKEAETAMAKGRNFQDRLMSVTWFTPAQGMGMRGSAMRSVILLNDNVSDLLSEHDDEDEALRINLESNEDFLLQDEEEEEDEERSWRR